MAHGSGGAHFYCTAARPKAIVDKELIMVKIEIDHADKVWAN
jgi:hypothetical protein